MEKETRDKREDEMNYHPHRHVRDVNSREIFQNNLLASQFLKKCTDIPIFSNIEPEDVEDVTKKYQSFLGIEFETDTVKKISGIR